MIRICIALLLLALPAQAQNLPALYDVYDVASDDVLNVRTAPNSSAEIIGALTPAAKDIEVIRSKDGWALINYGERAGWTSMRYLSVAKENPLHSYPAQCFGTEPFWSLKNADEVVFELAGVGPLEFALAGGGTASGFTGKSYILGAKDKARLTAIITRGSCNDGMSDHEFGLNADIVLQTAQGTALYSGCCTLK